MMSKPFLGALVGALLLFAFPAAAEMTGHQHPDPEVMKKMMAEKTGMPAMKGMEDGHDCVHHRPPAKLSETARLDLMVRMLSGRAEMDPARMKPMMDRVFFLDRADELGLSGEQVAKLEALRADCRRDNIRTGAELKIVLLDLGELLGDPGWTVEEAAALVRKARELEGDIQVRHLKARAAAREVLTEEQRARVASGGEQELERLFE